MYLVKRFFLQMVIILSRPHSCYYVAHKKMDKKIISGTRIGIGHLCKYIMLYDFPSVFQAGKLLPFPSVVYSQCHPVRAKPSWQG